ncbi:MAG TPA: hypothetical protein VM221_13755 [Armatimonadota bacterium]|nr:hypothetical protein [Armatimonadota bacterium]
MDTTTGATTRLRQLINDSGKSLSAIARDAGVSYDALWRWMKGKQPTYTLADAEKVYRALTGLEMIAAEGEKSE